MSVEIFRLEATRRYLDCNLDRQKELDQLAMLASQICGTPISLITLMDEDIQLIKAGIGTQLRQMPRETSFCTVAIENDELMVVEDASRDTRFADIPVVAGNPHIRFYAGANLRSLDGYNVGTLCVYDVKPKVLTAGQRDSLIALAAQVSHIIELDMALKRLKQQNLAFMEIARIQSHELRKPVSSILGVMELINGEKSDLNPEYLGVLNDSVKQLDTKIRAILGYVSANSDHIGD